MNIPNINAHIKTIMLFAVIAITGCLAACGGGGGGGGDGGGSASTAGLNLSSNSVTFEALSADPTNETKTLQLRWTGSKVAGIAVGIPPGQTLPNWLQVDVQGNTSPASLVLTRVLNGNSPGHYSTTIRVVSGDINYNVIDTVDLAVSFDVVAMPTITPGAVNVSWVESEQPTSQSLSITRDSRVHLDNSTVDINSLGVTTTGNTLTVAGNAQSQSQSPGAQTGNLTATFSLNGNHQRTVVVPVTATVNRALNGPAGITTEINATTVSADLNSLRRTVTTATQSSLQITANSNVPWLTVTGSPTGTANNLSLALPPTELRKLANGSYTATITLTTNTPNVSPLQIPVSLNLRLPEVHFVAPVAFSDTVAADYVIVRGEGFADPSAHLYLGGQAVSGAALINDTEIRVVPGTRLAGSYPVEVRNQLGFDREVANLRVIDPPAYADFSMNAPVGLQQRIISSPSNKMVFSQMCYFCQINPAGTSSTVQRFTYNPATLQWTRTEHAYPKLYDIAITPDESTLIVLTETQLLMVDPLTMVTTKTVDLPWHVAGISRELAVMNNGLVLIDTLQKAYSMHSDSFIPIDGLIYHGGIESSRDGSRAIFGEITNTGATAYRYYDSSTGNVVVSNTFEYYVAGAYSRHAERALVVNMIVDSNLALRGSLPNSISSGDLAPDGNRAYSLDLTTNPIQLRSFDVSTAPFVERLPATPLVGVFGLARLAVDPRGKHVIVISESKFIVVNIP